MKKLIKIIAVWLIKIVLTGKYADEAYNDIEKVLTKKYQSHKRKIFKLKSEIIQVKKGELKYKVAYFETNYGKMRTVIKRHPKKKIKVNDLYKGKFNKNQFQNN